MTNPRTRPEPSSDLYFDEAVSAAERRLFWTLVLVGFRRHRTRA
jgi:hypothetical protein